MDNTPEKLTGEIIQLVTKHIAQQRDKSDLEPILRSIGMAYIGFAGAFRMTQKAQELLIDLADALDDPELFAEPGAY